MTSPAGCSWPAATSPDEFTYLLTKVLDERKEEIHELFGPGSVLHALTGPLDLAQSARELKMPLHPGAEAYYREKGYIIKE